MSAWANLLSYAPLLVLLCWAAVGDLRARVIRNWLTFSLMITGLIQSVGPAATVTPGAAALGLLTGFGLLLMPFAIGAIGGGDVKLLAGIGAWVGPIAVFQIFAVEAVIGMGIVLAQAAASGRLKALFQNSAVLALNMAHADRLGTDHLQKTAQHCRSIDRPLPYAVPTLAATLLVLALTLLRGGHG
jgi:prepilin peptidase CpaA